jgi:hypothetical protein
MYESVQNECMVMEESGAKKSSVLQTHDFRTTGSKLKERWGSAEN